MTAQELADRGVIVDAGERLCGPGAIVARISASLERFDATHHLNGNHVTAVHGDEAEHTYYYQAQHVRLGLPDGDKFLVGGRYDDRLRRTPGGWRFTHRSITSVWSEGNPAVITS
jgi:SnoaL-like protein